MGNRHLPATLWAFRYDFAHVLRSFLVSAGTVYNTPTYITYYAIPACCFSAFEKFRCFPYSCVIRKSRTYAPQLPTSFGSSSIRPQFPFSLHGDLSFPILENSLTPIALFPPLLAFCRPIRLPVLLSPLLRVPAPAQLVGFGSTSPRNHQRNMSRIGCNPSRYVRRRL